MPKGLLEDKAIQAKAKQLDVSTRSWDRTEASPNDERYHPITLSGEPHCVLEIWKQLHVKYRESEPDSGESGHALLDPEKREPYIESSGEQMAKLKDDEQTREVWTGFVHEFTKGEHSCIFTLPWEIWPMMELLDANAFFSRVFSVTLKRASPSECGLKRNVILKGNEPDVMSAKEYLETFAWCTQAQFAREFAEIPLAAAKDVNGEDASQHSLQQYIEARTNKRRLMLLIPEDMRHQLDPALNTKMRFFPQIAGLQSFGVVQSTDGSHEALELIGNDYTLNLAKRFLSSIIDSHCDEHGLPDLPIEDLQKRYAEAFAPSVVPETGTEEEQKDSMTTNNSQGKQEALRVSCNEVRSALRHLVQPVALITATRPGLESPHKSRGVTVSSFCTVTLDPKPIISFNLRVPSRTWNAIYESRRLCVHLLSATSEGATAAHAFTRPYELPHQPFELLEEHGGIVHKETDKSTRTPPTVNWPAAVHISMQARLLVDKCVNVGDHVVVLAEVDGVENIGGDVPESGLLAYGRRGYRVFGNELKPLGAPEAAKADSEVSMLEARKKSQDATSKKSGLPTQKDEEQRKSIHDIEESSPLLDEKSLRSQMEQTEASYNANGFPNRTAANEPTLEETLKAVRNAWEASPTPSLEQKPSEGTSKDARDFMKNTMKPPQHRTFSSWTQAQTRNYSSKPAPSYTPIPEKILKSTVAEYLCPPQTHNEYWANMISLKQRTDEVKDTLDRAQSTSGMWTDAEIAEMEDEVVSGERKIARDLAIRHALDLQNMLDSGNFSFERAQILEHYLEQGQAALMLDAKALRQAWEEQSMSEDDYERQKKLIVTANDIINRPLMRLRALVEEDEIEDDFGDSEGFENGQLAASAEDGVVEEGEELPDTGPRRPVETEEQIQQALKDFDHFFKTTLVERREKEEEEKEKEREEKA